MDGLHELHGQHLALGQAIPPLGDGHHGRGLGNGGQAATLGHGLEDGQLWSRLQGAEEKVGPTGLAVANVRAQAGAEVGQSGAGMAGQDHEPGQGDLQKSP